MREGHQFCLNCSAKFIFPITKTSLKSIPINIYMFKENLFYSITNKYILKVNICPLKPCCLKHMSWTTVTTRITRDPCRQVVLVNAMLSKKLLSKLSKSLTKSRYKKSCYFYKNESSQHLFKIVPLRHYSYTTSNAENIPFRKNIIFQKLCYPFQLLSSETVLTMKCEMPEALVYLKTVSWDS